MDLSKCKHYCLHKHSQKGECAAFTLTDKGECRLLMRSSPFLDSDVLPVMEFNAASSVTAIKRCFVSESDTVLHNNCSLLIWLSLRRR